MVLVQPEERVAQEKVADLVAPVVEDERAPVLVLTLPGIFVLEQGRAVEVREAVRILRKVPGHPVQQHANAPAMTRVDERLEVFGPAESARRRIESRDLVSPGSEERVLHDRQQLDVREAHLLHVGHELLGKLAVTEEARLSVAVPELPPP